MAAAVPNGLTFNNERMAILATPTDPVRPNLAAGRLATACSARRSATRASCAGCCDLPGRLRAGGRPRGGRLSAVCPRAAMSAACAAATRTIPCCGRCCRWPTNRPSPGYAADPVGDAAAALRPGLLQKYPGRALMVTTGACAVHCRYCFRRHYPYSDGPRVARRMGAGPASEIAADQSLHEVLLSGGDPLTLVDDLLARLAERLAAIGHLRRLRIHTRLPIVIPERVCDELARLASRHAADADRRGPRQPSGRARRRGGRGAWAGWSTPACWC